VTVLEEFLSMVIELLNNGNISSKYLLDVCWTKIDYELDWGFMK